MPSARVSIVFTRSVRPCFVAVMSGCDEPNRPPPWPGKYSSGKRPPPRVIVQPLDSISVATPETCCRVPVTTSSAVNVGIGGIPIVNTISYRDTGVILAMTPRVNESDRTEEM
jgi:hypothetical protein